MLNATGALFGGNGVTTKAGITGLSGAATTFSTGSLTIQFSIKGKAYSKAQISGGATPTTDANTSAAFNALAASKACAFVFCLDSSGNTKVCQGPVVSWTDTSANSTPCPLPSVPDTLAAFAYVVIKNGSTGTSWTFGSSNWNQSGITIDTPVDIHRIPAEVPLTA